MQPEMVRQLQALQEQAARLGGLARGLSRAVPQRADGTDATGWVRVVLDRTGRPADIQVRNGWDQRMRADQIGAAVGEACVDAVRQGMRAWSESLDDSRWHAQRSAIPRGDDDDGERPDLPAGEPREVTELAEVVLSRLQSVRQAQVRESSAVSGSDDEARVTIHLEPGGAVSCVIDERWAVRRTGDAITTALTTALSRARSALAGENPPAAGVDGLIGDVLATLESFKNQ